MVSMSSLVVDRDTEVVSLSSPRSGGPSRRRSFTPAQKLDHVAAYESALERGEAGAYLRREGLYSSLMSEWRRQRDAGLLAGKSCGQVVGAPSAEQAEIARLKRRLARTEAELGTTQKALDVMGKLHALLEDLSRSADTEDPRETR